MVDLGCVRSRHAFHPIEPPIYSIPFVTIDLADCWGRPLALPPGIAPVVIADGTTAMAARLDPVLQGGLFGGTPGFSLQLYVDRADPKSLAVLA